MAGRVPIAAVLLFVLAVVVSGQPPEPCCVPTKYSVTMTDLLSIGGDKLFVTYMEFDFDNKKQAMVNSTYDPSSGKSTVNSRIVLDFGKGMLYFIPGTNGSQCYKSPNPVAPTHCVPDDAKYMGSSYLGPMTGGLSYDGWKFTLPSTNLGVTIALTTDGCVPLVEKVSNPSDPTQDKIYFFNGYVPRITDPSLFNLPPSCNVAGP